MTESRKMFFVYKKYSITKKDLLLEASGKGENWGAALIIDLMLIFFET